MAENIAKNWKAFSGANNWSLLDEPINPDFLSYLIHYGERVQAIGDAFNFQKLSNTFGLPRFPPEELFSKVGLEKANPFKYEVANYFYLKSEGLEPRQVVELQGSAWSGYVAVTKDHESLGRRDILVCWRGTLMASEWWQNIQLDLVSAADIFGETYDPKMHHGFYNVYTGKSTNSTYNKTSAREQVLAEVRKLVDYYGEKGEEVSITVAGHSLGAALATINAMDIVANGFNKPTGSGKTFPVTAFAYASPRVGDKGLLDVFDDLTDIHILRISNSGDPVPYIPLSIHGYEVVANKELIINSGKSPYLKDSKPHELEIYLHGIAGYNGQSADFSLVVLRDLALVNKTLDILKDNDNLKVLPNWWDVRNNLMTQHENGFWDIDTDYVADPPSEDDIAVLTKNTLA